MRGATIKLGALLFLFLVGLEIDLRALRRHGVTALLIGTIGSLVPLAIGAAVVYWIPTLWGEQASAHPLPFALFVGACMANSANPVLGRILLDLGLLKTNMGAVVMTATVVDDLIAWSLLPVVFAEVGGDEAMAAHSFWQGALLVLGLMAALLVFGQFIATPLLAWLRRRFQRTELFIGLVVVIVLVAAALSEKLGLHAFLGPFLVGLAIAPPTDERGEAYDVLHQFVMSFFAPLYFVSLGLTSNFIANFDAILVAVVLVVACVSKILSAAAAARLGGMDGRMSWAVGFGMNARGATGIILAALGREQGLLDERTYVALVVMALLTSIIAAPAMRWLMPPVGHETGDALATRRG